MGTVALGALACQPVNVAVTSTAPSVSQRERQEARAKVEVNKRNERSKNVYLRQPYPLDGLVLGQSWDTKEEQKRESVCVEFAPQTSKYQDSSLTLRRVSDKSTLARSLGLSAKATFSGLFYSVSASVSFLNETSLERNAVTMVANARVQNGATFAVPAEGADYIDLKPAYARLLQKDRGLFRQLCGDRFVVAIHSGAELRAVYKFAAQSAESKSKLDIELKGKMSFGEFSAKLNSLRQSTQFKDSITIDARQLGGWGDELPTDEAAITAAIKTLSEAAEEGARPFEVTLLPYHELPKFEGKPFQERESTVEQELVRQYLRIQTLLDEIDAVVREPTKFVLDAAGSTMEGVERLEDELHGHADKIREAALQCISTTKQTCKLPASAATGDYEWAIRLPARVNSLPKDDANTYSAARKNLDAAVVGHRRFNNKNTKKYLNSMRKIFKTKTENPQFLYSVAEGKHRAWVFEPSRARCDLEEEGCLPNLGDRSVSAYRDRILCETGADPSKCPTPGSKPGTAAE